MINKLLRFIIKNLVNLYYKRTHFLAYVWGIDELNGISILSEEVMLDKGFTRFGTKEIAHTSHELETN